LLNFFFKNHLKITRYISLSILIYLIYKSEYIYNGSVREYYYKYILIFLCIFIFFKFAENFRNKNFFKYTFIIIYSFFFSLYLLEAYLIFQTISLKKNDTRNRYEIYTDLKKLNNDITLSYHAGVSLGIPNKSIYPLAGISNKKTIFCNELGYYAEFYSDKYGFNNSKNKYDINKINYVLIGDSFIQGACVKNSENISSQLEIIINEKNNKSITNDKVSLNLGITSSGPLVQYAILREYLPKNIENILYFYYEGNDLLDLSQELQDPILKKYLDINFSQNLVFRQNEVDIFLENLIQLELQKWEKRTAENTIYSKILKFIKLNSLRAKLTKPKLDNYYQKDNLPNSIFEEYKNILKLIIKESEKRNSKFYFIYLPELKRYKEPRFYNLYNYEMIKEITKDLNIQLIDMHVEIFDKKKDPTRLFPYQNQPHYTPDGYALIAKKIAEKINER